jgi:hypothetical protein
MRSLLLVIALVFGSTLSVAGSALAAVLRYAYVGPVFDVATGPLAGERMEATFDVDCALVPGNGCRNTFALLMLSFRDYRNPALRRFRASVGELAISDFGGNNGNLMFDSAPDAMPIDLSLSLYGFNNDVGFFRLDILELPNRGVYLSMIDFYGGVNQYDDVSSALPGSWTVTPVPVPAPPSLLLLLAGLGAAGLASRQAYLKTDYGRYLTRIADGG